MEEQTVLLIDDGMHTGWTLFSALEMLRNHGARRSLAAVPVTHFRARRFVGRHCDQLICIRTEETPLYEIGNYYEDFSPVSNEQIQALLKTVPPNPQQSAA